MSLEGQVIGPYRLPHHLGSSGLGEVYLAEDMLINRRRVTRVLRAKPAGVYKGYVMRLVSPF